MWVGRSTWTLEITYNSIADKSAYTERRSFMPTVCLDFSIASMLIWPVAAASDSLMDSRTSVSKLLLTRVQWLCRNLGFCAIRTAKAPRIEQLPVILPDRWETADTYLHTWIQGGEWEEEIVHQCNMDFYPSNLKYHRVIKNLHIFWYTIWCSVVHNISIEI